MFNGSKHVEVISMKFFLLPNIQVTQQLPSDSPLSLTKSLYSIVQLALSSSLAEWRVPFHLPHLWITNSFYFTRNTCSVEQPPSRITWYTSLHITSCNYLVSCHKFQHSSLSHLFSTLVWTLRILRRHSDIFLKYGHGIVIHLVLVTIHPYLRFSATLLLFGFVHCLRTSCNTFVIFLQSLQTNCPKLIQGHPYTSMWFQSFISTRLKSFSIPFT